MASGIRFLFSHAFFVSLCAVALAFETSTLAGQHPPYPLLSLIFFATLAAYNFYVLAPGFLSKKGFSGLVKSSRFILMAVSSVVVFFCLKLLPVVLPYMMLAGVLTLIYSLPRAVSFPKGLLNKLGFLKTLLLAVTWTGVTVLVPAAVHAVSFSYELMVWLLVRFFFMLILCILFDTRDVSVDAIRGLNSLATDISRRQLHVIIHCVFGLYVIAAAFLPGLFRESSWWTAAVTYFVFRLSLRKQGYYFYYFLVDGLMLFSALMIFLATF